MKRLITFNLIVSGLVAWATVMKWPVVDNPRLKVEKPSPEVVVKGVEYERAVREVQVVLNPVKGCGSINRLLGRYAVLSGVKPRLVAATVAVESSCRADAISKAGAVGLMQIVPSVYGLQRRTLLDPERNIAEGTRILAANINQYGERQGLRHYFGVTPGSTKSDEYADRVLTIARSR